SFSRQFKRSYAGAARLYADALAANPRLGEDPRAQHRYNAARSAALAAAGHGEGARPLPDKVNLMLRRQALRWLRADLAMWVRGLNSTSPDAPGAVQRALQRWLRDTDLAGVRDQEALAKLPADERLAWLALWAEVANHAELAEARVKFVGRLE